MIDPIITAQAALNLAHQQLQRFASNPIDVSRLASAFGTDIDGTMLNQLANQWAVGDFEALPAVGVLPASDVGAGVDVVFSPTLKTLYLTEEFVLTNSETPQAIANKILQGIGYAIDAVVSAQDSPGDEGRIFSLLVQGIPLDPITLAALKTNPPPPKLAIPQLAAPTVLQLQIGSNGGDWVAFRPDLGPLVNRNEQITASAVMGGIQTSGYGFIQTDFGSFSQIVAEAGGGDDRIDLSQVGSVPVNVLGGTGNDEIVGGDGADDLNGGEGNDRLEGGLGNDAIAGGGGRDIIVINRGDGTDRIEGFGGVGRGAKPSPDTIAEVDILQFNGEDLTPERMLLTQIGGDLAIAFEDIPDITVILDAFALENLDNLPTRDDGGQPIGNILFAGQSQIEDGFDVFNAEWDLNRILNRNTVTFLNDLDNDIRGFNRSNDVINGQGGDDVIRSLSGNDLLRGGEGDDRLMAGSGNDRLIGGLGGDELDGGSGIDIVSYISAATGIIANLTTGTGALGEATNDRYRAIENLEGSNHRDRLFGDRKKNQLWGLDGDDRLDGRGGNDRLMGGGGRDRLLGGDGNDVLDGGIDDDNLNGGEGDDRLVGGEGDDLLAGEAGVDELWGQDGDDVLNGGEDNDTLWGGSGNDELQGGEGKDDLHGGDNNDTLQGGEGRDRLYGDAGADVLEGGDGNDFLSGGEGDDPLLAGGFGDDRILGGGGNDALKGDGGQDTLEGGDGADTLEGGDDDDRLYGGNDADDLFGGEGQDTLWGHSGDDRLFGELGNDRLFGNEGRDNLEGGTGDDRIYGGMGEDELSGGNGDDILSGNEDNDLLEGDDGNDRLIGGEGNDRLQGGIGVDTASYETSPSKVVVNLDATQGYRAVARPFDLLSAFEIGFASAKDGFGTLDTIEIIPAENLVTVENIVGSDFDDVLIGDRQDNQIQGLAGNDLILGNSGSDALDGGDDIDTVSYHKESNAVWVDLQAGIAIDGSGGTDTLSHIENVIGTDFADRVSGDKRSNRILAGLDNDLIAGGGNQDTFIIYINDGTDTITDFGGVGRGNRPSNKIRAEVDVLKFEGDGFTAKSMILTQNGENLEITFDNISGSQVILEKFALENLDNLPGQNKGKKAIGNILFDGQSEIEDSFDVFNSRSRRSRIWNRDRVTFLNALDNHVLGFERSDDVINAQEGDDLIRGLSGNDLLRGEIGNDTLIGDAGDDTLVGGLGADQFQFNAPNEGIDLIQDFSRADGDSILLSLNGFGSNLSLGALSSEHFTLGAVASRESDRIIYDSSTGALYFDADGTGILGQSQFAQLSTRPALNPSDILVVA